VRRLSILAACAVGACASVAASEKSSAGRALYGQNCARCHGFGMVNPGPGIFDLRTFPGDDKARFVAAVSEGKGAMPSWKAALSAGEIDALWDYVRSGAR
jgi:cytochrome c6